jgi:hypothetical protein
MKLKTYGVSGLMDWTAQIKVGKATMSVHFTGGALTAYGVTPAKYSTSNAFYQRVIEESDYFKSGRIQLLSTMDVPGDATKKPRKAAKTAGVKPLSVGDATAAGEGTTVTETPATPATPAEETPAEAEQTGEAQDGTLQDDGSTADGNTITVSDKYEAIEYLKEHFADKGYTATGLRTKAAFEAACRECGVTFMFTTA